MHPISEILCEVYNELYRNGQVKFALRDKQIQAIDSTVKTVNASYFGFDRYKTNQQKAVAYLCFLIKNHPVVDGNKRLGALTFAVFCLSGGLKPDYSLFTLDQMAVAIAKTDLPMEQLLNAVSLTLFNDPM